MEHKLVDIPEYEGLAKCTVCKGAEGSLPSTCPGRPMSYDERELVFTGKLDYFRGKWWGTSDFEDVGVFHEKFGLDTSKRDTTPRRLNTSLSSFRIKFLEEELREYKDATAADDLPAAADALVDLVYVALGTAHMHGLPWPALFNEVQRANMTKMRAADHIFQVGGPDANGPCATCTRPRNEHSARGSSYDVVKPHGWRAPEIAEVLKRHGWKP